MLAVESWNVLLDTEPITVRSLPLNIKKLDTSPTTSKLPAEGIIAEVCELVFPVSVVFPVSNVAPDDKLMLSPSVVRLKFIVEFLKSKVPPLFKSISITAIVLPLALKVVPLSKFNSVVSVRFPVAVTLQPLLSSNTV